MSANRFPAFLSIFRQLWLDTCIQLHFPFLPVFKCHRIISRLYNDVLFVQNCSKLRVTSASLFVSSLSFSRRDCISWIQLRVYRNVSHKRKITYKLSHTNTYVCVFCILFVYTKFSRSFVTEILILCFFLILQGESF